ncbi:MAG: DUF4124 domain-containing protein [Pseudomonas sp.]|uniref:DUF4124 domain-containing protein n=1 Tax=Pseudomonas abieticivorans TaxID=2931382 RepID=UPI0020C0D2AD|nr:DUF4124 domain-containing protein [Pseudomonas sp. PIA16]MDE1168661.1 DUF4124 domain-containing protein [Pseudomonas sp.]
MRKGWRLLWLTWGCLASLPSMAADTPGFVLYRYIDSRGVTVLDRQGVPPDVVAKGYQVLNQQGRVIQTVPPAPSADEVRAQIKARDQAIADAQLLRQYSSLDDLDRARARKLAEVDGMIAVANGNLQTLQAQQDAVQAQAADQERNGRQVPQVLLDQVARLREERARVMAKIADCQASRPQVEQAFAEDRARLAQVLSRPPGAD